MYNNDTLLLEKLDKYCGTVLFNSIQFNFGFIDNKKEYMTKVRRPMLSYLQLIIHVQT